MHGRRVKAHCWILRVVLGICSILFLSLPVSAAEGNYADLQISQSFTVKGQAPLSDVFQYEMTALEPGNPMPEGSEGDIYRFSIEGSRTVTLGPIVFETPGIYHYTLNQTDEKKENYNYDSTVYQIDAYVIAGDQDVLIPEFIVRNLQGEKVEKIDFQSSYREPDKENQSQVNPGKTPQIGETKAAGPKTGDTGDIRLWSGLVFMSGMVLTALILIRRYKKNQEDESQD